MKPITSFSGDNRFLSNFWPAEIPFGAQVAKSVEHAYQASKTLDVAEREWILEAPTAGIAKRRGRDVTMREGWDDLKDLIMLQLVAQKFLFHTDLRQRLLETGDAELIEGNRWGDTYWGQCPVGTGENKLGKILMFIREGVKADANS